MQPHTRPAPHNAHFQPARRAPEWFSRGVMYQIQPRAFTPEGTLAAAAAKLPYLRDLGVSIVYLVPVMRMDEDRDRRFWSPRQIKSGFDNPRNQYRIADYFHVDPEYGSDRDLADFCAAAHALGMRVVLDIVYFHCGPTAPFLREHPGFTWWNADGSVRPGPWRYPQLDFSNPELREYLMGNMEFLVREYGADGFRCDVGSGIPLDFWCDAHDRLDALTGGEAALLCEGFATCNQFKGFDADYGWFPGLGALTVRDAWEKREAQCPVGSRFVNHYENHDLATDERPRREDAWGHAAVDQVLVWMFALDGVPMLFCGNEMADADPRHSMFGKTPMDWTQLDREPGRSRHALVRRLAAMRRGRPAFTDVSGSAGLAWLDTSAPDSVSAFVRRSADAGSRPRCGGDARCDTLLVVQNWTDRPVTCDVSFEIPPPQTAWYLDSGDTKADDHCVRGSVSPDPILARAARLAGTARFELGPWGFWISDINPTSP